MECSYGWKVGAHIKVDAGKVGKELELIDGPKTPRLVVSYAEKHKKSELHKHFEWDNETAGDLYRLQQAGHILRCIVIEKTKEAESGQKQVVIMRAYENVKTDEDERKTMYVPTETALSVPEYQTHILSGIRKGIYELQEKARIYETYLKNAGQFRDSMDTALKSI